MDRRARTGTRSKRCPFRSGSAGTCIPAVIESESSARVQMMAIKEQGKLISFFSGSEAFFVF
jgi:hypothetical protein